MTRPTAAITRLKSRYYNENAYAAGNPGGLDESADGLTAGHVKNFPDALVDLGNATVYVGETADTVFAAQQTLLLVWDSGTAAADPGAGKVRGSTGALTAGSYNLMVSTVDALAGSIASYLADLGSSSATTKARARLVKVGDPSVYLDVTVTGVSGSGSYRTVAVTYRGGPAGFASGDAVALAWVQSGDKGDAWLTPTGAWSNATAYAVGDGATYQGSTWRCIAAHTNQSPPALPTTANAYWSLVAAAGSLLGGNLTGALNEAAVTVASAATLNIGTAQGNYLTVTGTTGITAFDAAQAGTRRLLRFAGALTITHNAASLILIGAADLTTVAGDLLEFVSEGGGNWRQVAYCRPSALPFLASGGTVTGPVRAKLITLTAVSNTFTVDCSQGNEFDAGTIGANSTFANVTNLPPANTVQNIAIRTKMNGTGGYTFSFGGNWVAMGNTTYNNAANKTNTILGKVYPDGTVTYSIAKGA